MSVSIFHKSGRNNFFLVVEIVMRDLLKWGFSRDVKLFCPGNSGKI